MYEYGGRTHTPAAILTLTLTPTPTRNSAPQIPFSSTKGADGWNHAVAGSEKPSRSECGCIVVPGGADASWPAIARKARRRLPRPASSFPVGPLRRGEPCVNRLGKPSRSGGGCMMVQGGADALSRPGSSHPAPPPRSRVGRRPRTKSRGYDVEEVFPRSICLSSSLSIERK